MTAEEAIAKHAKNLRWHAARLARGGQWDHGLDADDLFQEACLAVVEALQRFDPSMGAKLSTFIQRRAFGAMVDAIRSANETHSRTLGRVASKVHMSALDRRRLRDDWHPAHTDPTPAVGDFVEDFRRHARKVFGANRREEVEIITQLHANGRTIAAIGVGIGVTESRVSQIVTRVMREMCEKVADHGWTRADVADLLAIDARA